MTSSDQIRFVDLASQRERLRPEIDDAITRVLDHGQFIMGPEVERLEDELARFTGAQHVVTCSSGTTALALGLMALGIGHGDAVLVPSFTFAATASGVTSVGATPVFVDVEEETFNMDPQDLDATAAWAAQKGLSCKAVIPVDLFGLPSNSHAIGEIAQRHGLEVVIDAAQSLGAESNGRRVGTMARLTTTSFFPSKPLGCYGDGGAIFTDDSNLADVLRSVRVHGQGSDKYDNVRVGTNGRLDTMQAAVLLQKLSIFEDELATRRRVAATYTEALSGAVNAPSKSDALSAWAHYTIRVPDRDQFRADLTQRDIPTAVYYPVALHDQPAYESCPRSPEGLGGAELLAREVVSLPMHPYLPSGHVERVIEAVARAARD